MRTNTAIVLGGTRPHTVLIEKLKSRGYRVVLVDYLKNPFASDYADEHVRASTLDLETVLKTAVEKQASLVISTCIDQANSTACYVAEKLGLPAPYSYATALAVTKKNSMKERMMENGIPTARYAVVSSTEDFRRLDLLYPLIVKPADSNSSKGVRKIESAGENISEILDAALSFSRIGKTIVEEYIQGTELGIDCFVKDGKAHVLMIKERRKIEKNDGGEQQIAGCLWPFPGYREIFAECEKVADRIAEAFGLRNCPLMIQAILRKGEISVIEFGARIGGGESYKIIKEATEFDYMEGAIDSFLGREVSITAHTPEGYYADNFIYAFPGIFDRISVDEKFYEDGTLEYCYASKTAGTEIGEGLSSNNRVGTFVVKGKSPSEVESRIGRVLGDIQVYDTCGNPMMRKDIY